MINIITPYRFCETTLTAINIANIASSLDDVQLITGEKIRNKNTVHPYWDQKVKSIYNKSREKSLLDAKVNIYLYPYTSIVNFLGEVYYNELITKNKRSICVVHWHSPYVKNINFLKKFEIIVTPSRHFKGIPQKIVNKKTVAWVNNFSDIQVTKREGLVEPGKINILVYFNKATINNHGIIILHDIARILGFSNKVRFQIICPSKFPKRLRNLSKVLQNKYGKDKIKFNKVKSFYDFIGFCCKNDWFFYTPHKTNFSILVSTVNKLGMPVLAFDIPPVNEVIINKTNGILIPCTQEKTKTESIRGKIIESELHSYLDYVATNPKILTDMQKNCWLELDNYYKSTFQGWYQILEKISNNKKGEK